MTAPVTPAEAREVWNATANPSARKVSDKFKAAGRPISFKTVNKWRNANWNQPADEAAIVAEVAEAVAKLDNAVPVLTGQVNSQAADLVPTPPAGQEDTRGPSERTEDALFKAITTASAVYDTIVTLANMKSPDIAKDAPPIALLIAPEGIAKLMKAASDVIATSIQGFMNLPALRETTAKPVQGEQTIIEPVKKTENPLLRASIEHLDHAIKEAQ